MISKPSWNSGSRVFLLNPAPVEMRIGSVTPRWLGVMAAATPGRFGRPVIVDETLRRFDLSRIRPGDVVGISLVTPMVYYGYALGRQIADLGAVVIYGGPHPSILPDEALDPRYGRGSAVVIGDGELVWGKLLEDNTAGNLQKKYKTGSHGRLSAEDFLPADWASLDPRKYLMGSVQTVRGCPKKCSYCSVWVQDGRVPRQRPRAEIMLELVALRRLGIKVVIIADDNFNPFPAQMIRESGGMPADWQAFMIEQRRERFRLLAQMAQLPGMSFFTQITMEVADEPDFLQAMKNAGFAGVLVGVETITKEGLEWMDKSFNSTGAELAARLRRIQAHMGVLASCIFGLPTDKPDIFAATLELLREGRAALAQFVRLTVYAGTVDFKNLVRHLKENNDGVVPLVPGTDIPVTSDWLLPPEKRRRWGTHNNPTMTQQEIAEGSLKAWKQFYRFLEIFRRVRYFPYSLWKFVVVSKGFLAFYSRSGVGISADAVRDRPASLWIRLLLRACRVFFHGKPMPDLQVPELPPDYVDPEFVVDPVGSDQSATKLDAELVQIAS